MHEIEVKLRLQYEEKLLSTRNELRGMESRFVTLGSEFEYNIGTTKKLYNELSEMKKMCEDLNHKNNELNKFKEEHGELKSK